jgi:hypothetical protein
MTARGWESVSTRLRQSTQGFGLERMTGRGWESVSTRLRQSTQGFGEGEVVRAAGGGGLGLNPKLAAYYPLIIFCGERAFS